MYGSIDEGTISTDESARGDIGRSAGGIIGGRLIWERR